MDKMDEDSKITKPLINNRKKTNSKRKRDFCFYCEEEVLNFARHITRNHIFQTEVQQIMAYPKKSKKRNQLLNSLRKKGNYILNSSGVVKPMRSDLASTENEYLPCSFCFGFYKKKQLWRHRKTCTEKQEGGSKNAQADGQNFLLRHLKIDWQLRDEVFPRMRADKVSLVAKKDPLICAFGAKYLKMHREKHFINVTSRKMRELGKLLIELRKKEPKISSLFDALQPKYYDTIIEATKMAASYSTDKDKYESPTFAMNIVSSLKQCANIAILYALKKKEEYFSVQTAEAEANLKTLIQLLTDNWRYDISAQAANDLNLKKWNKVTLVPLAADLKLLKEYLIKKVEACRKAIKTKIANKTHYCDMVESIYCRILLLNRRRPGELQRVLLNTYRESSNPQSHYEEFDKTLSKSEQILLRKFKRLVIRGKRNRGVPVLLSEDVQADIDLLLSIRGKYIPEENLYLFARPGYSTTMCGYKVLNKMAKECGAKYPDAISATRLRKHLATLTQILSMTENDLEQLSTFMGHTSGIHKKSYRLPDDVYQTAKMSKLLLLMEDGKANQFKGKSLEEIDLNLGEELNIENEEEEEITAVESLDERLCDKIFENPINEEKESAKENTPPKINVNKKKRDLIPWTAEQKLKTKEYFKKHINKKIPPKKYECEKLIALHPNLFTNKNWLKIKVFVQNVYTNKCK
ncbi:hypothetical protein ACJJTC_005242 [Scirpophaga incertulas]